MLIHRRVATSVAVRLALLTSLMLCFLLVAAQSFAATNECAQCHGDNVAAGHHESELYSQGLCNQCHEGVTTNGDCATCHTFVPQQNGHHDTAAATSGNCAECHTNVGDLADCLTCHQGKIRTPHHDAASDPNQPIDCASCHSTMEPLAGCLGCHGDNSPNSNNIQDVHHNAAADPTDPIDCQTCHAEIEPITNCESCHNADYWGVNANNQPITAQEVHHSSPSAAADCTTCHTDAPRPFNCHDCHQGEAADRHHVLLGGTLTCSNCHDDIQVDVKSATTDCQNCHEPSATNQQQHHDMAISNPALSCNTCHSDAGNVPGCASCHDNNSWGNSGSGVPLTARDKHHEFINPGTNCNACHSSMVFDTSCDACHSSGDTRMQEHHNPENPNRPANLSCGFCHGSAADIPNISGDPDASCLFCHDSTFWQSGGRVGSSIDQHHEVVLGSPGVADCSTCHDTLVPQTCATCHDDAFWTEAGRVGSAEAQHHDVVRFAGATLACADCHDGGLPGENNDCQACHFGEARTFHHEEVAPGQDCQECHTDLPEVVDCESCHTSDSWVTDVRTDHHNSPSFNGTDCMQCHTGVSLGTDCESCHTAEQWQVDAKSDHHDVATSNGINCNNCHDSVTTPSANCRSCHAEDWTSVDPDTGELTVVDPETGLDKPNLHHSTTDYSFGCLACHSYVYTPVFGLAMPDDASCETCHSTEIVGKDGSSAMHHETQAAVDNQCGECHVGIENITPASLDCASCHATQDSASDGSSVMHHASPTATAPDAACADCHSNITQASLDCATCHSQQTAQVDLDGTPAMHHDTQAYVDNQCTNCHQNVVALDCAGCHIDESDPNLIPIPQRHHDSLYAQQSSSCADCHTGADVVVNDCELCHVGNGQPEVSDRHHATPSYFPGNCASCHEGIDGVSGDALDCAVCHADKNLNGSTAMHHQTSDGAPNTAVDNCATCHTVLDFDQLVANDDCFNCHSGGNSEVISGRHHATSPAQTDTCSACHSVSQAELDCATCHANQSPKDGKAVMHHATPTATGGTCTDCHSTVDVTNVTCASCHASQPVFNGGLAMHHNTILATNGNCTTCHTGADSALMNCESCHTDPNNPDPDQIAKRHHSGQFASAPTTSCTDCHTKVDVAELDCALCHAQQPADLSGSEAMHHDMTIAGTTKQCATCHVNAVIAENDCSACHTGGGQQIADTHHATEIYQLGDCSVCHVGAEPQGIVCAECHGNDSNHHIQPTYADGSCNACHTDITLNGANCESCHTGGGQTIPETHHGTPLDTVGGDCSVCHQAVSTPDVCANCHSSVPHHNTQAANYGLCESCHSWPADKNENPQQASCRQCHGQYMHDKNSAAPIHDYRACFDCHGSGGSMTSMFSQAAIVLPFHASPGRAVGLSSSSDAQAPGRGSFNLFYDTWGGSSRNEERFGEHERWKDDSRQYRDPQISYTRVQISEQGQTYQVPAFPNISTPDIPGGTPPDGGTGGTGLEDCTNCHGDYSDMVSCENMKWRDHQTLNRVDLATYQLAESTYLGSYCPDLPPEPEEPDNLALNKSASSSDDEGSSYRASRAVDGDANSRWYVRSSSRYRSSSEWLKVDLGDRQQISQIVIKWHSEYAREYDVEVSNDDRNWTRVEREESGNGGTDTVSFSAREARYVRVECNRSEESGYSIYELEVYK